jgi:hypothetical protein
MHHTEKELSIARRYRHGECNDVQLNYLISTERLDRCRMEKLIATMENMDPFVAFAKVLLIYIMIHFAACVVYSLAMFVK